MTDEENKAIKDCDSIFICLDDAMSEDSANDYRKSYKILKNLIEKQSKEIEELKEKNKNLNWYFENQKDNFVHKDKIKAKIEDIESQINDIKDNLDYEYNETMVNEVWRLENKIDVLQSLLEKE